MSMQAGRGALGHPFGNACAFLCLLWLLCLSTRAMAQAAPVMPAQPPPMSAQEIVERTDSDERLAVAALQLATAPDPTMAMAMPLQKIADSVDARSADFPVSRLRTLPIMRLESLARHWTFDRRRFERWRAAFNDARSAYLADASLLATRRAAWDALDAQQAAQLPALGARIAQVRQQLAQADTALSSVMAQQIALGQRANGLDVRLQQGQDRVTDAITRIDRQLLHIDSPPIWRAHAAPQESAHAAEVISSSLQIEADFAGAYAEETGSQRLLLNLLQLLMLPALLWLSHRSRHAIGAGDMSPVAARVMGRPWSSWLLLCMAALLVMEPDAPLLIRQIAMMIALIPVLRLLPPGHRQLLDVWPYVATILYLIASFGAIFMGSALVYRWFSLVLAVLALAATGWLLWRSARRGHGLQGRLGHWLRGAAWFASGLLLVSIACNIAGNVSLAEMLLDGVVYSAYFGLVLYVMVNVVTTLLQLLLGRPGASRFRLAPEHAPPLMLWLFSLTVGAAVIGWALYAMESFRILRPLYTLARTVLEHEFTIGDFSLTLGHILLFVVATVIAFWAAKATRLVLHEVADSRLKLQRGTANSVASLAYYGVLLLGLMGALSVAGFKTSQLALIFGALGVGIGFGLQNVVNNFVSGLILMFERPVQPGDVIDVGTTSGRVREIGLRATRIRTFDGADVIVPNGTLLSDRLTNWTLFDRSRRIEVPVGVAYGSDPRQVAALLEATATQTPGIASAPAASVLFSGFGASSLDFVVRAWTPDYDHFSELRSTLHQRIYDALVQAGIEIPFPQQDVHLHGVAVDPQDTTAPKGPLPPA